MNKFKYNSEFELMETCLKRYPWDKFSIKMAKKFGFYGILKKKWEKLKKDVYSKQILENLNNMI